MAAVLERLIGRTSPQAALRRAVSLSDDGKVAEAFPLLARAAKAGLEDAEFRISRCYLEGLGVPASRVEGARWLERAANHGHVEAQTMLAALCINGLVSVASASGPDSLFANEPTTTPDFASALKWARAAADAGSASGDALLGYVLTYGPETMRDAAEAHRRYERSAVANCAEGHLGYALSLARRTTDDAGRRQVVAELRSAAQAGLPTAIYLLGALVHQGFGISRNPTAALKLYHHAAEMGQRAAQMRWGLALIEGKEIAQDLVTGETWLRRAALAGDAEAAAAVGDLYAQNGRFPPNFAEAAVWYHRAAQAGHHGAARSLGALYRTGSGVAQDKDEAARWLNVSAAAGDRAAQVNLANLVLEGAGGSDDPARVARWFEEAAASGDLVAAFNFGICLARGVGVERDAEQAAEWLRRAAEGVPDAQHMYGRMLAEGRGVPPDIVEARNWYARAADGGIVDAQVALAEMMVNGRGGPRDPAGARALFEKAASGGNSGAMFALGAMHSGSHGIAVDRQAALRWFRAAAELGHGHAQMMLGRYLYAGAAGECNPVEAREWLERAVAQGIDDARHDLEAVSPSPPSQRHSAGSM
jgi:hypothetical protein